MHVNNVASQHALGLYCHGEVSGACVFAATTGHTCRCHIEVAVVLRLLLDIHTPQDVYSGRI